MHDLELLLTPLVSVDHLAASRGKEGLFLLLELGEGLLFVEILPPAAEGNPIIALISLQYLRYDLAVLGGQLVGLGLPLQLQLHPVVQR